MWDTATQNLLIIVVKIPVVSPMGTITVRNT
jgi:hypothetical protein